MVEKKFIGFTLLFIFVEILQIIFATTIKNYIHNPASIILMFLVAVSIFAISIWFPKKFNLLVRYSFLFLIWGINTALFLGLGFWPNASISEIAMGVFAVHFILTFASFLPYEKSKGNGYIALSQILISIISFLAFPFSISLGFFSDVKIQLIIVCTLGTFSFLGEVGITILKHLWFNSY